MTTTTTFASGARGLVTIIPAEIRDALHLKRGDSLRWHIDATTRTATIVFEES